MADSIIIENNGAIRTITLNRPQAFNSFDREMGAAFQTALDEAEKDDRVRCIVIKGEGKAFCAGQDLIEATQKEGPSLTEIVEEHYNPIIKQIRSIEKPVIAAVNGVAAGAGASLALCCDIVIACENASFIQAFSKIGLIPDSGATFFLPRLIGMQKATGLMMTGEPISAMEAEKIGMIYKVFSNESFEQESLKLAKKLAKMATKGLGLTKRLLNSSYSNNLGEQLNMEKDYQTIAGNTVDYQEGVEAFLEKRKPEFKGK